MPDEPQGVSRRRRWPLGVAVGLGLLVLLAGLVHTPPVRRAALRQVVAVLEDSLDIVLAADSLQYNLPALRVTLQGVRMAATHARGAPFLQAKQIDIAFPVTALWRGFALDLVRLDDARLSIDMSDEALDVAVTIPGLAIEIGPAAAEGTPRLLAAGQARRAEATTLLTPSDKIGGDKD